MTNPTPHGQVPEALIDLIDAYAETRHRCGGIYNPKTEAARKAVIEALSGAQALRAGPVASRAAPPSTYVNGAGINAEDGASAVIRKLDARFHDIVTFKAIDAAAASPTPPAEQQATKETSGGFHVWRDIATAPKDGSRFVATGHNYGLYSEVRHTCVAQWFRGCWVEASDWNETSELKYLTHWMPLPSPPDDVAAPAEQQAPSAAAADTVVLEAALRAIHQAIDLIGEPDTERLRTVRRVLRGAVIVAEDAGEAATAPQPAPAPLSDDVVKDAARWRWLSEHIGVAWNEGKFTSLVRIVSDNNRTALNASIDRMMTGDWSDAAIAAHGGNKL